VHGLGDADGDADPAWLARFTACINDDLNYPRALAVAWELLKSDVPDSAKKATLLRIDEALGLDLLHWQPAQVDVPQQVQAWMAERAAARMGRRWAEADRLRALARAAGYDIDDTPQGQQARAL
jgi:cysteinyl-tRNA synthetase